jgi:signal recognition particle subunit SRP54
MAKKIKKGKFDLEGPRATSCCQMKKMGGMGSLMNMMPGMNQMKEADGGPPISTTRCSTARSPSSTR